MNKIKCISRNVTVPSEYYAKNKSNLPNGKYILRSNKKDWRLYKTVYKGFAYFTQLHNFGRTTAQDILTGMVRLVNTDKLKQASLKEKLYRQLHDQQRCLVKI